MPSLKHSVSHCFGEILWNGTDVRNMNKRCSVSCTNLIQNDGLNLLVEHVPSDPAVVYLREESLNSKSQNIQMLPTGGPLTKYFNDFRDESGKDERKSSLPNISDDFKEVTEQEKENDELLPLTFVVVPPILEIKEPNEGHEDGKMFLDSFLKDPLGEYSGNLDITDERRVKKECTLQSELQVKNEPKNDDDIRDFHSYHELTGTECNPSLSCDQENATDSKGNFLFSDTFYSEGCAFDKEHDLEIKSESICEISGADVKEEKICESGQCLNHTNGDGTGTFPLEPKRELLINGDQHSLSIDIQQDVKAEDCHQSTSEISSLFALEIGNKTSGARRSVTSQFELSGEGRKLKQRTERNSLHIASFNLKKQDNNQHLVPSDGLLLDPSEMRGENDVGGKMHIHAIPERNYSCVNCRESFTQKIFLEIHMRMHTGDKQRQCLICKKSFYRKTKLNNHMRTHTTHKPFQCDICRKSFHQKDTIKSHLRTHTGDKPFQCELCKLSFSRKEHLKSHMRTHTGDKPFQCERCKQSFTLKHHLRSHMLTHTGEKPFKCDSCRKSFSRKEHLKRHMGSHTGDKPFQCEICKQPFTQKNNLKSHLRLHTEEKTFECDMCKQSYTRKDQLKSHIQTHFRVHYYFQK